MSTTPTATYLVVQALLVMPSPEEWDPEIGLYYYRARYYDSQRGRFTSEDPIADGDIQLYAYVHNAPGKSRDPSGEEAVALGLGGAVLAGGTAPAWVPAVVAVAAVAALGYGAYKTIQYFNEDARDESGSKVPPAHSAGKRNSPDQDAAIQLAKEARQKKSLTAEEAEALVELAKSVGVPARGPETHPDRPHGRKPHIHVGPVGHSPVRPAVGAAGAVPPVHRNDSCNR